MRAFSFRRSASALVAVATVLSGVAVLAGEGDRSADSPRVVQLERGAHGQPAAYVVVPSRTDRSANTSDVVATASPLVGHQAPVGYAASVKPAAAGADSQQAVAVNSQD